MGAAVTCVLDTPHTPVNELVGLRIVRSRPDINSGCVDACRGRSAALAVYPDLYGPTLCEFVRDCRVSRDTDARNSQVGLVSDVACLSANNVL